ncbi:MAG: GNAT family N-acetyltransferase, partial [Chloroflexi bacterium]
MNIRQLERHELPQIWTIDRREIIENVYCLENGKLVLKPEHYDMQGWPPGEAEHYGRILDECFERSGAFLGAFEDGILIGVAILESEFIGRAKDQLQLKFLHVSRGRRGTGLGTKLFELSAQKARELGARRLYISATPSENTVNFYRRRGCFVTQEVDPALFALEPEDIHLEYLLDGHNAADQESALIAQYKKCLGPIQHLDYAHLDAITAHQLLGRDAGPQIHKILARRLDESGGPDGVAAQIRRARADQSALREKIHSPALDERVRSALNEYMVCLSAWADGAELGKFRYPGLPQMSVDDLPVTPEDLAFSLQEDEVGCQTGVFRERDGSVILWHTEEDYEEAPGQRFDKLRLFSFRAADQRISTGFIYPDLLPGPTFGWHGDDFVQAIDTLHVKPFDGKDALTPNTLTWLSLYLGAQVSREELARQLGPFKGGYSLTGLSRKNGVVGVEKIEFANDDHAVSKLENDAGCYLFQTNVIADLARPIGAQEQTSAASRAWNEAR